MSSDEGSTDSSSHSGSSNVIGWNERLNDFYQWQTRVNQQDHQLQNMIENYSNANQLPHPTPRARRKFIERDREDGHSRLMNDYFVENPVYPPNIFRLRFRMQKHIFLRIVNALVSSNVYFQQRPDATGRLGLSPLQKCTAALRILAYGYSSDAVDEYLRLSKAVAREALIHFVEGVISNFGDEYLREPNEEDMARLLHVAEERGFPGMIGSIDCMHWEWKNCPTAWAGQYTGRSGKPTVVLEAVASYDLWIWHAFFGTPGIHNDITVLHRSPVFNDILEGRAPELNYVVNNNQYDMGYYLTDGIYPQWAAFVKSINAPQIRKHKLFAQHQEAARKDIERAFGVLQSRFAYIRRPCQVWDPEIMGKIIKACIIMHNMIVEDERHTYLHYYDPSEFINDRPRLRRTRRRRQQVNQEEEFLNIPLGNISRIIDIKEYMSNRDELRNRDTHNALMRDLIEHIWQKFGYNS